ncbi:MAG: hypothetical protein IKN31_04380 [Bacteroidales bacterium]|nr:hypothetical protein [Bacteroidales bacterium]
MSRLFVILLAFVLSQQIVKAQVSFDPVEGCLNVVDFTAGKGFGESGSNIISARYLHERFINERFCVGLGVGYSYLNRCQFSAIPLFFSTHYFLLDKRFSPFVNIKAGLYWPVGINSNQSGVNLYLAPSAGVKLHITPRIGILASLGYDAYLQKTLISVKNGYQTRVVSNLDIGLGVCFQIPGW